MNYEEKTMSYLGQSPPISRQKIKNLGKAYRGGLDVDREVEEQFFVHQAMMLDALAEAINRNLRGFPRAQSLNSLVASSRLKTVHTTRQKLQRMRGYSLDALQDIVGVRLTFDASLSVQEELAKYLEESFLAQGATKVTMSDTRVETHSGYRAIHLRINFPAGRTEIQLRTILQAKWANLYEAAGDTLGREIRYVHLDSAGMKSDLHPKVYRYWELSDMVRHIEERIDLWEQEKIRLSSDSNEVDREFLLKMKHHAWQLMHQEYDDIQFQGYERKDGEYL